MAYTYRPELLEPYLKLDQGEKVQAECECRSSPASSTAPKLIHAIQMFGSMLMATSVQKLVYVFTPFGPSMCRLTIVIDR